MHDIDLLIAEKALERSYTPNSDLNNLASSFGGNLDPQRFKSLILDFLSDILKLPTIESSIRETEMRLRIALHFSCSAAINFDNASTNSTRWGLIKDHLVGNLAFSNDHDAERIARLVARVLDDWDISRIRGLQTSKNRLLKKQNYLCACCHLNFSDPTRLQKEEDLALCNKADQFKPYFDDDGVSSAMAPHVDHKTVVSKDGTNQSDNLQVLCALCNFGKGANSGIRPSKELDYCCLPVNEIPRSHRMALLFYRLMMDENSCTKCGSKTNELTVRKVHEEGLVALTNLRTLCYYCITN